MRNHTVEGFGHDAGLCSVVVEEVGGMGEKEGVKEEGGEWERKERGK